MDEETRKHLESLNKSVLLNAETVKFMLAMDQRTLLILVRMAYVLERLANRTFELEEAPDERSRDRIVKVLSEIRAYFDEQQEIMQRDPERADE